MGEGRSWRWDERLLDMERYLVPLLGHGREDSVDENIAENAQPRSVRVECRFVSADLAQEFHHGLRGREERAGMGGWKAVRWETPRFLSIAYFAHLACWLYWEISQAWASHEILRGALT